MPRALDPETNAAIVRAVKAAGYKYISLDLQGYRTGSLNEVLDPDARLTPLDTLPLGFHARAVLPTVARFGGSHRRAADPRRAG